MQLSELPASSRLDISNSDLVIAEALRKIFGKDDVLRAYYFQPVQGTLRSERIISDRCVNDDFVLMPGVSNTEQIAHELFNHDHCGVTRRSPDTPPTEDSHPGWEIRVMCMGQRLQVAYVCAAWA